MNIAIIMGRITKEVDVKYTTSGKCVASFTLAVNRPFKNEQGKYDADFIPVVVWGKAAELVGNSCQKGHRLIVEGRIQVRSFEDKSGNKRYVTEVIANNVEFVEKRETKMEDLGEEVPFN
jgi:single-strand DNA-binding protein